MGMYKITDSFAMLGGLFSPIIHASYSSDVGRVKHQNDHMVASTCLISWTVPNSTINGGRFCNQVEGGQKSCLIWPIPKNICIVRCAMEVCILEIQLVKLFLFILSLFDCFRSNNHVQPSHACWSRRMTDAVTSSVHFAMHRIGLSAILAGGEWENMKSITKLGRKCSSRAFQEWSVCFNNLFRAMCLRPWWQKSLQSF
jgi:hypothetical protein